MKSRICLLTICFIISCNLLPTQQNSKTITIDKVYWVFENIPPDYEVPFSLTLDVTVKYSGASLHWEDIDYGIFTAAGLTWDMLPEKGFLNDSAKCIAYSWQYYRSSELSTNSSIMPIGDYEFIVKLKNGNISKKTFDMPAPGMKTSGEYKFIYTEDYKDQITASFYPMVKRPNVGNVYRNNDTIIIEFTTDDTLSYNGWVWLFNADTINIGSSIKFRNSITKGISTTINNGNEIATNGDTNYIKILSENCRINEASEFNDIRSIRLVVTDGRQYASESNSYDCRAIGNLTFIK